MYTLTYLNSIQKPVLVGVFQNRGDAEQVAAIIESTGASVSVDPLVGINAVIVDPLSDFHDRSGT